jgi:hypothetical protein
MVNSNTKQRVREVSEERRGREEKEKRGLKMRKGDLYVN